MNTVTNNAHAPKVLIVDDNRINRLIVGRLLKKWGFAYREAENANDAFYLISDKSYSLILMDINMPDVNGLEASKFIRSVNSAYFQQIPIIAFSAHMAGDIRSQIDLAGINDFVSKPFDPQLLREKIESVQTLGCV